MSDKTTDRLSHSLQRVIIVHGYEAAPDAHWFPWLQNTLEAEGVRVTAVPLPDPDAPEVTGWENAVGAALGVPDAGTVIVAHSLGAITALRVLAGLSEVWELGGIVLVAGFVEPLESLPELDRYLSMGVDVERLAQSIRSRTVIRSETDPFVPPAASDELAKRLDAQVQVHPEAGHFMAKDGVTRFPAVLDLLRSR
ncbi:serine hydrolase family protein [Pseudarthrobacter phenanthrenivorans]|uniref:Putative esterase of the alpha/beta hydrolase fold family n=1 Tax=Pseudarthrobacter phenanthrenivorans (strain DSM 18606 / JCM 16027 / LMG 23796 / Sphe3) TaxID=930171 RepID=F0MB09_PSEPM|nr:alpha/beta hydrolase [Pseudarthrobacter phenanthrenivorans]ADX72885.1 putative esterase of the alpha/beta hydrolase fold family [Pseudarthrobacter phenanthrenivorans Sphe3]TPV53465.1 serine hydrolase family protein [Pseudarthrobacter phenanthrenivorans]